MKIEGNGEVQVQVQGEEVPAEAQVQEDVQQEEVTLPSDTPNEELIAGKFKSQDDLLKAYQELEKKLGQPKEEPVVEQQPEVDPEYEAYKEAKAKEAMFADLGGAEVYDKALEWAKSNMTKEQITEYNNALAETDGKESLVKLVAKGLIDQYKASTTKPTTPNEPIHSGETTKVDRVQGYETKSDMMKDMSDPRYSKDERFRQKVAEKLALTDESRWYR